MKNPEIDWASVEQAARTLGIAMPTMYIKIRDAAVPHARIGETLVIPRAWVEAALATKTMAGSRARIGWATALDEFNAQDAA